MTVESGGQGLAEEKGERGASGAKEGMREAVLYWFQGRRVYVGVGVLCFMIFTLFSWNRVLQQSADTHFVYQADAFLHGQLELTRKPPHENDWATYRGKSYVSFPPFPAVLFLPLVALFGFKTNDVLFTLIFAALNMAMVWGLLERFRREGKSKRTPRDNAWLLAMFGFGTAYLWCAVLGQVWFTAQIVGITMTCLYIYAALDAKHPFWAGLCLALGALTRTPLAFAFPFFLIQLLFPEGSWQSGRWREIIRKGLIFAAPVMVLAVLAMMMNEARFDDPLEFGHTYLAGGRIDRIRKYGLFHYHFLAQNLCAAFTLIPKLQPQWPFILISKHGMSILLTTPALMMLLWPKRKPSLHKVMWLTILPMAIPSLFYQNSGFEQFGYRFILDYMPYLILLFAMGDQRLTWKVKALIIAGMLVNAFGAITFKRIDIFYHGAFFPP